MLKYRPQQVYTAYSCYISDKNLIRLYQKVFKRNIKNVLFDIVIIVVLSSCCLLLINYLDNAGFSLFMFSFYFKTYTTGGL